VPDDARAYLIREVFSCGDQRTGEQPSKSGNSLKTLAQFEEIGFQLHQVPFKKFNLAVGERDAVDQMQDCVISLARRPPVSLSFQAVIGF
jgi:hypothetical protein